MLGERKEKDKKMEKNQKGNPNKNNNIVINKNKMTKRMTKVEYMYLIFILGSHTYPNLT